MAKPIIDENTETRISLRDYFAAVCLQGILPTVWGSGSSNDSISMEAYALADKMMEVREVNG